MITVNVTNDHIGELFFPVREADVQFLQTFRNEKTPKGPGIFGLFRRKIKPYIQENADWFFDFAKVPFEDFLNFFKMDKEILQENFLMGALFRDRALQRIFNRKYASKEDFIKDLSHKLESYRFPDESDKEPLPVCMTANLFITIYFVASFNTTVEIPDNFIKYILPVSQEGE